MSTTSLLAPRTNPNFQRKDLNQIVSVWSILNTDYTTFVRCGKGKVSNVQLKTTRYTEATNVVLETFKQTTIPNEVKDL